MFAGRPEEQDDSENSTIYITGLTEKAKVEEMAEFFKHVGPIRVSINEGLKEHIGNRRGILTLLLVHLDEPQTRPACDQHLQR